MKYDRLTTPRLITRLEKVNLTIGKLWFSGDGPQRHLVVIAREELEEMRTILREELLARVSRERRASR